ncbi:hypothetical protein DRJ54_03645 [Candidatus Acetothermia bacterium]|nr:MAG: hypothetical protein DRJ54_03645 [Candidatus Acetothermia bacterium]
MTGKVLFLAVLLALGTGLVGGLIGVALFSGGPDLEDQVQTLRAELENLAGAQQATSGQLETLSSALSQLEESVGRLQGEISDLKETLPAQASAGTQTPSSALAVAYVDLTGLMNELFQPVQNTVDFKNQELQDLRQRHEAGEIDDETYQKEALQVEVELLAAPLHWDLELIDKMAASPEFADLRDSLEELRDKVLPLQDELQGLRDAAEQGDIQTFLTQYQQLSTVFQQLDQLVSQVVQAMLAEITRDIAQAQGYALVLRKEDALYLDTERLADLTPLVKARVPEFFP